jgi:hypothetical protein
MFKWLSGKSKQATRRLWENEFNVVERGLDEEGVIAFVNRLIAQHRASERVSADSLRSFLKTAVTNAEQIAASIKTRAQVEAEAEAAKITNQAQQESQDIRRRAQVAAQREAEDILQVANKKAEITEVETKQKALLFLLRAREEIEQEVSEEYKQIYARLSSSLQRVLEVGQSLEVELKSKRAQLWEGKEFELEEQAAALLKTPAEATPSPETLAPEEEPPVQLKEEIAREEIEEPVNLEEEVTKERKEPPARPKKKKPRKRKKLPAQPKEEVAREKIEEPVKLEEEVLTREEEPPARPMEEATEEIAELVEPPLTEEVNPPQSQPLDSQTIYNGEVELAIAIPVELRLVSKFYNYLQKLPDMKILHTRGSWDRGTTIAVVLDKPTPLIGKLLKIPDIEVIPELDDKPSSAKEIASSLRRGGGKGIRRIKLTLKETKSR